MWDWGNEFIDAGIELKVTPYKRIQNNLLSAKERLVLNIIDYNTEYKNKVTRFLNGDAKEVLGEGFKEKSDYDKLQVIQG